MTEHERWMLTALEEARMAEAEGEVPVGAALVRAGRVLARAHNRCRQAADPTAHAELLCIREALPLTGGRLTDCTLYVTLEPCAMCAGACVNAKLLRLVYGAFDPRAGCCGSVLDLLDHALLWSVEVWGGVLESECAAPLRRFFQARRG